MSKPYVLGIDIGGTNTVFGIVDPAVMWWPVIQSRLASTPTLMII